MLNRCFHLLNKQIPRIRNRKKQLFHVFELERKKIVNFLLTKCIIVYLWNIKIPEFIEDWKDANVIVWEGIQSFPLLKSRKVWINHWKMELFFVSFLKLYSMNNLLNGQPTAAQPLAYQISKYFRKSIETRF